MYGKRLRQLRLEHGYTMEEVGNAIGIKKSSYASYEVKYRQPPLEKLKKLALLYGVSVDYIIGLTEERNFEKTVHTTIKTMFLKRGLHWDGDQVPEEVLLMICQVLEEATERYKVKQQKEG